MGAELRSRRGRTISRRRLGSFFRGVCESGVYADDSPQAGVCSGGVPATETRAFGENSRHTPCVHSRETCVLGTRAGAFLHAWVLDAWQGSSVHIRDTASDSPRKTRNRDSRGVRPTRVHTRVRDSGMARNHRVRRARVRRAVPRSACYTAGGAVLNDGINFQ